MSIAYCHDCERIVEDYTIKNARTEICQWCHGPVSHLNDEKDEEEEESS